MMPYANALPMFRRLALAWLLLGLFVAPVVAQEDRPDRPAVKEAAGVAAQELEALIATLESEPDRQRFIADLRALLDAQRAIAQETASPTLDLVGRIAARLAGVDAQVEQLVSEIDDGSGLVDWLLHQARSPKLRAMWTEAFWQLAVTLGFASAAWLVLARLVRLQLGRLEQAHRGGWAERVVVAIARALLLLLPVAAFAVFAYLALMLIGPNELARVVAVTVINATVAVRLVLVVARCLFSPLAPQLRPLPIGDEQSAYLFVWSGRFAAVAVYGFFVVDLLGALGMPEGSTALLLRLVGLAVAGMAIVVLLQSREPVAHWIRTHPESGGARRLRQRVADVWHVIACVAVVVVFVVWALDVEGGFVYLVRGFGGTAFALFAALLASTLLRRLLHRLFRVGEDMRHRFPGLEKRANSYVAILSWALNAFIWLIAALFALDAWGLGLIDIMATPAGAEVVSRAIAILIVALVAILVWEMGDGMISRALAGADQRPLSPRMKTLLPLLRNALLVTVAVIAVITAMSEIGIDIAPLLAGAGVVGLAIGFGAQALVRDIITGAIMLFEDQFAIGDWIDAGGKSGGVEGITIRTIRLRDIDGYVHTVPFGEITVLTNMMRDFGYAVIDVGVDYGHNTDEVIEVIREADSAAREDVDLASRLAGPLEVLGVNALGDSSVTIRVRVRTGPGQQWAVRREYLRRIKLEFDRRGIGIPFPQMTVWFGELKGGGPSPIAHVRIDTEWSPEAEAKAPAGTDLAPSPQGA